MTHVLTLNSGSSSIKFALYANGGGTPVEQLRGQVEGLGATPRFALKAQDGTREERDLSAEEGADHGGAALKVILTRLEALRPPDAQVTAIGHRVVHGGPDHSAPIIMDDAVIDDLERLVPPLAPLHQPANLAGIHAARAAFPDAVQVACFDTAFHRAQRWEADTYALPKALYDEGIRRYGFHGLSYEYVSGRLAEIAPELANGRVIIAHLGNGGASMCAVHDGHGGVGSSMGFTALDGLPMGTRCGQLDPGVVLYLMAEKGMSADEIETLLYRESGLKGLSGISHDMRTLEQAGTEDARRAISYFVHRIKRELGGQVALLGGLDALVFCGGIGENATAVRAGGVCEGGLDWAGISIDAQANAEGRRELTAPPGAATRVFVIQTDEEQMIARHTAALLA